MEIILRFVDLFSGLGGFHFALEALDAHCVYAVEIDPELRRLYQANHRFGAESLGADITRAWKEVPDHDVLCAGFPCQPFSKSGAQMGRRDETRGTLFDYVLKIARKRKPRLILLENVGNFARHDGGNTWDVVRASLQKAGYDVVGTEHVHDGGSGLLSPHHFGFPHVRERFFAVAALGGFSRHPLPVRTRHRTSPAMLSSLLQHPGQLSSADRAECALSPHYVECISHWNKFIQAIPASIELPSFPIWGDEFTAAYPEDRYLTSLSNAALRRYVSGEGRDGRTLSREELLACFPTYMRNGEGAVPRWKLRFIQQNREFFHRVRRYLPKGWLDELRGFKASHRKLEWNCQGEERDLWNCVLQLRPSGLRAKRFDAIPALVAMTETQTPILGPQRRFITRREAVRLLGMPDDLRLPPGRPSAFRALGNAVHVGVVRSVYEHARLAMSDGSVGYEAPSPSTSHSNGDTHDGQRLAI